MKYRVCFFICAVFLLYARPAGAKDKGILGWRASPSAYGGFTMGAISRDGFGIGGYAQMRMNWDLLVALSSNIKDENPPTGTYTTEFHRFSLTAGLTIGGGDNGFGFTFTAARVMAHMTKYII